MSIVTALISSRYYYKIATIIGIVMLYGYRLQVDNIEKGIVKIEAL